MDERLVFLILFSDQHYLKHGIKIDAGVLRKNKKNITLNAWYLYELLYNFPFSFLLTSKKIFMKKV